MEISTSILNIKQEDAIQTFYNLEMAKTDYFHIDVMDGKFVKNNNLAQMKEYTLTIKHISNLPIDVHLMVKEPDEIIKDFIELNVDRITIHIESNYKNIDETILKIKNSGVKVGLAISPKTPLDEIIKYLPYVHMVLVMTVEPGLGGQELIEESISKIYKIKKYLKGNNIDLDIEADGGIKENNISKLKEAGVDISVVGTAIINAENYNETIRKLKEA